MTALLEDSETFHLLFVRVLPCLVETSYIYEPGIGHPTKQMIAGESVLPGQASCYNMHGH